MFRQKEKGVNPGESYPVIAKNWISETLLYCQSTVAVFLLRRWLTAIAFQFMQSGKSYIRNSKTPVHWSIGPSVQGFFAFRGQELREPVMKK